MTTSCTVMSMMGCAFGMQTSSDPESGTRSVTVGTGVRPSGGAAPDGLDRTQVPPVGDPVGLDLPEIQDYTRPNGLRVILVERTSLPLVSLLLQVRGGAAAHEASKAGLAAFTADMLDEGTTSRTALEIAGEIELLGASLSSSAGYDANVLHLSVLRPRLDAATELLADMVVHPTFPAEELDRVRTERLARVLQRSDVPGAVADDAFARVLYGDDHPYGLPLLGTARSLEGLTREDVVAFHGSRYAPGQSTLVVAGDVSREDLDALLDETFAGWSGAGVAPAQLLRAPGPEGRTIYLVDRPGAAQSELRVGRIAVDRGTDEYYPLTVMNTVLGGSFTSRLNSKLREEKGFTYGAGSYFAMRRAPGPFEASAAVATPVTDSAVADLIHEVDRMAREDVPSGELDRAKRYLSLSLPRRFESVDDVVGRLAELALHDLPLDSYERYVDGVYGVGADRVRWAAGEFVPSDDLAIVIAGDRAAIEEPLRALGLGPVVVLEIPTVSDQE